MRSPRMMREMYCMVEFCCNSSVMLLARACSHLIEEERQARRIKTICRYYFFVFHTFREDLLVVHSSLMLGYFETIISVRTFWCVLMYSFSHS